MFLKTFRCFQTDIVLFQNSKEAKNWFQTIDELVPKFQESHEMPGSLQILKTVLGFVLGGEGLDPFVL